MRPEAGLPTRDRQIIQNNLVAMRKGAFMKNFAVKSISFITTLLFACLLAFGQQTTTNGRPPLIPPKSSTPASTPAPTGGRTPLPLPKPRPAAPAASGTGTPAPASQTAGTATAPCAPASANPAATNTAANRAPAKPSRIPTWLKNTPMGQQAQTTISNYGANLPAGVRPYGTPGTAQPATMSNNSGPRSTLNTQQGLGSFPGCCGYNLTAYSCLRNNSQVLCDFDVTNQGNIQANAEAIYRDFHLVGTSGRVFGRSNAYFVDTNGSPFTVSQLSSGNAVRYVMVFDNVPNEYASVSLAQGQTLIQGVQLTSPQAAAPAVATTQQ
jgi:hypothetical protein